MSPHHAFPDISWQDLQGEIRRELASRRDTFPGFVARGRMTQAEADRQLDIFAAILEDALRFRQARPDGLQGVNPLNILRAAGSSAHTYTWGERRAAITRELDYRARLYPGWIDSGRITKATADIYTRRLTCMRAVYELGYDWTPNSPERALGGTLIDWLVVENEIAARDGVAQEEMAL